MTDKSFPIIAIGASAGGVEALSDLFDHLPHRLNAAFVVVTHLAPQRESLLPQILSRHTGMVVEIARDGVEIASGHVYLNCPDGVMTLRNGALSVQPRGAERNPIDIFLASLAVERGEGDVAAILSGTGHDGALGVKAIREGGGFTLAQGGDHGSPRYPGMPLAAAATGFVDCVLPLAAMAERIAQFVKTFEETGGGYVLDKTAENTADRLEEAKRALYSILQYRVGHDFSRYKDKTFLRRVERRMQVRQCADLPSYVELIRAEPEEATFLFRDLLIGVTSFFRDEDCFDGLGKVVVPRLLEGRGAGDVVRVWVPGCATGEEAYSIAMLLREALSGAETQPKVQIFATDVDDDALAIARAGRYPANLLEGLSQKRKDMHFTRDGPNYVIDKQIRDLCLFSSHSLIRDPPFSKIDLISCRNLLIYFKSELQNQVLPVFHYALNPNGFLFLGASENVSQHGELFAPVDKKLRIFQRREVNPRSVALPLFTRSLGKGASSQGSAVSGHPAGQDAVRFLENRVLEAFAPAHVLVNEDWDIAHYSARTGKYFEAPAGTPSRNLLSLARKGLRLALRSALNEVLETGRPVKREAVDFDMEGRTQSVDITIEPLPENVGERQLMVVFSDVPGSHNRDDEAAEATTVSDGEAAFVQLEKELKQTRERLQISIEEYETSVEELKSANEELLSMNEELQSSNEELETSREELQSVNEELNTVNSELASKVDELDRANNDLKNLFNSTQIATIFLDRNLMIRNFTPAMAEVFKVIPNDRGRCLADIVSLIDASELMPDFYKALENAEPVERYVDRLDGTAHYLMRIFPYRDSDNKIDGGVLTFVNVTTLMRNQEHQRLLVAELNHRVKNMLAVVASMAGQMALRCSTVEEFAEKFIDRVQGLAKTHDILSENQWSDVDLRALLAAELAAFLGENGSDERVIIAGPSISLKPRAATTLGIVFHELATNGMKYGALGEKGGRVKVDWELETKNGRPMLELTWRELDGPRVLPPEKLGLGSELIERSLDYELGGKSIIEYRPKGLSARLIIPVTEQHMRTQGTSKP